MGYLKKVYGIIGRGLILSGMALGVLGNTRAEEGGKQVYDTFLNLAKNDAGGAILAEVKFAQDGSVRQCRVVRSNAPYALEASTTDFIESHWKIPLFAGETRFMPIAFDQLPSYSKQWNEDMAPPQDPLAAGEPERNLKLRLTFGTDGWIEKVEYVDSSGLSSLDEQTALWVKVHWHHDAYANQVIDAPFQFEPPALPPTPPPPVIYQKPAPPPEPVAIPAIRVE